MACAPLLLHDLATCLAQCITLLEQHLSLPADALTKRCQGCTCHTLQIMYSYVMNPKTLPASYWNFIVR